MTDHVPAPGPHGGDARAVARALGQDPATVLDLSVSLNPFAPDVVRLLGRHLDAVRRYPAPEPDEAESLLAEALGVDAGGVVLTNGGAEAIALVAAEMGGGVVSEPEFGLHPRGRGGPQWRSDPHNPTGRLAGPDDRSDVRDEAFYPLATGCWTRGDVATVVVGSLTKVFSCPGLRLGYAIADPALAARLRARRPAWAVNGLALAVLPDLLGAAALGTWQRSITARRAELAALLSEHGLEPEPSDAPWLLVRGPGLRSALAPLGVVVRDCSSFGLPEHVRIGLPDDGGMDKLARVLGRAAPLRGRARS